jgi:hypothetical protein
MFHEKRHINVNRFIMLRKYAQKTKSKQKNLNEVHITQIGVLLSKRWKKLTNLVTNMKKSEWTCIYTWKKCKLA